MALKVGELFATLNLDSSAMKSSLDSAKKSLSEMASSFAKSGAGFSLAFTAPITKAQKEIVQMGSSFESTMSEVKAISGATEDQFALLSQTAKEMGSTSVFSATESAEALKYMAMAGWDTEKMVSGLPGIINLAASSGEDLAKVSDIVTDALTAFGMQASESTHFADILAAASSNANTNVSLMGYSFKYAAAAAGTLGYNAEDIAIALGLMANAGIKGEMAGTQLRTGMLRLTKPTEEMAMVMEEYGLSLTNADGTMKSFMEMMQMYRTNLGGLTEAEKARTAAVLFGTEAAAGWLSIINASDTDFEKLTQSIYNSEGAAKQMSKVMIDNLAGDMTLFKSALEGAAIGLYDLMVDGLRETVQMGTSLVNWFNGFDDGTKSMIIRVAAFAAAIGPAQLAMAGLLKGLAGAIGAFQLLISPLGIAAAGMFALYKSSKPIQNVFKKTTKFFKTFISSLGKSTSTFHAFRYAVLKSFGRDAFDGFMTAAEKVRQFWANISEWARTTFNVMKLRFMVGQGKGGVFEGIFNSASYLFSRLTPAFTGAWSILKSKVKAVDWSGIWENIKNSAETLKTNIKSAFTTAGATVSDFVSGIDWGGIWDGIANTYESLKTKVAGVLGRIPEIINSLMSDASDFVKEGKFAEIGGSIIQFLAGGIESKSGGMAAKILTAIQNMLSDINFEDVGVVLTGVGDFFVDLIANGISAVKSGGLQLAAAIGGIFSKITWEDAENALTGIGNFMIDTIGDGITAALNAGSSIVSAIGSVISSISWSDAGESLGTFAMNMISAIAGKIGEQDFTQIMTNIGTGLAKLVNSAVNFGNSIAAGIIKGILDGELWLNLLKALGKILLGIWEGFNTFFNDLTVPVPDVDTRGVEKAFGEDVQAEIDSALRGLSKNPTEETLRFMVNAMLEPTTDLDENTKAFREGVLQRLKDLGLTDENNEIIAGVDIAMAIGDITFSSDGAQSKSPEEQFNNFYQSASEKLQSALDESNVEVTVEQAVTLGEGAKTELGQAGTEAGNLVSANLAAALTADTSGIEAALNELKDLVSNSFTTMTDDIKASGLNFSRGLANGIRSGKSQVISAAAEVARAALNTANTVLQIGSPSKLTEKMGGFFDAGFAKGILGNTQMVTSAASDVASMAANMTRFSSPAGSRRGTNSMGGNGNESSIDYDQMAQAMARVQLSFNYDGHEYARASASDVASAQNRRNKSIALGYGMR